MPTITPPPITLVALLLLAAGIALVLFALDRAKTQSARVTVAALATTLLFGATVGYAAADRDMFMIVLVAFLLTYSGMATGHELTRLWDLVEARAAADAAQIDSFRAQKG
jgi:uncharacterized membrane protein HdeD (DUF308 family)